MNQLHIINLGLTAYKPTWDLQHQLFESRLSGKIDDVMLLNEHHHVYTLGKNSDENHLLTESDKLRIEGVDVFEIDRGGDVTYHGPGQLVGYPILKLDNHYSDVHRYLRDLEEVIIRTLSHFGIQGQRDNEFTGVWVGNEKIAAIGVKVSHWITMHGFALNVNTDLSYFDRIIPCGIFHKGVTSMQKVLDKEIPLDIAAEVVSKKFGEVFGIEIIQKEADAFLESVHHELITKEEWQSVENK